ncbi:MAG: VWA domain-containing protein [Candidatus Pseudobacter hemicellulosilyticus]|uniref:VWA domain-containing protein n=1 Tax=Candidatus Pseudobacter hemicellulosilyticus TaxID=3121375 RepID=A0AAJ6BGD6_9BACT|nr:MAG: VWA domain-containing protein [Pseudobacter sp.]
MFRFQHTEYLIGLASLLLVGGLFYWLLRWKRKTLQKIGDEKLVKELIKEYSPLHFLLKGLALTLALAALILGAANLQRQGAMEDVSRKGVDVVIAMDVSRSMLAEDIQPNRLERARQLVYKLMDRLPEDRIGLVLFAGRAYMQMPLSTDHAAARMYLQQAGPDAVPTQGTVLAEALRLSNTAFNSKERKYKSIVLITDGEDHDEQALTMAKQMAGNGVILHTIGIGSPEGSPIPDPLTNDFKKDENGNTIISRLNETELQQLAEATHGTYTQLTDIDAAVSGIEKQLSAIEASAPDDNAFRDYKNYFQWFIGLALVLLLAEFFFPERKWQIA